MSSSYYDENINQDILFDFLTKANGRNNQSTYETDGYIRLYYDSTSNGDSLIYSRNLIDWSLNYTKLTVRFKLVGQHNNDEWKFRIGFDYDKLDTGALSRHTWSSPTFTPSNDIQTYELDLTTLSLNNAYLRIGAVADVYIYSVTLTGNGSSGKGLYVGKNGNKKTTDFFTWLNGLKYRVIEGYTWKNGLCYQFYGGGSSGYSGLRLAFDYDYEVGQTYTKNTENIIDVADYIIEKNALVTYSTGATTLTQAVKSKKSEILAYISGLLISTDDTAIVNYSCSFGSSYAGGGLCQINLYIGHSNLNSLTVSQLYYNSFYPRVDWNRSSDGRTRLQISFSCYADGTLTKSSRSSTRSVGEVIGQYTYTQSSTYNFDYIYFLCNIGTHIERFSSGNIIANFDYTRSFNDTVDGINGYLNRSTSTRDSQGLHKTDILGIQLPQWLLHHGNAVEVSIGTTSYDTSSSYVPSLIAFRGAVNGQIFLEYLQDRNTWSFVRNTSYYDLNISDFHYFDNSTVKMSYSLSDGKVALYKNNTLVYQSSLVFDPTIQESSIIVMNNTTGLVKTLRVLKE